jgi:hypothetical protein
MDGSVGASPEPESALATTLHVSIVHGAMELVYASDHYATR